MFVLLAVHVCRLLHHAQELHNCAKDKVVLRRHNKPMKVSLAPTPLRLWPLAFFAKPVTTSHKNEYLLANPNLFSKLVRSFSLRTTTAETVLKAYVSH